MDFCSQLPELYVITYVCSLRVQHTVVPLYTWLPHFAQLERRTLSVLPWKLGDVLILESIFRYHLLMLAGYLHRHVSLPNPLEFIHVGTLSYSWIDILVMITSILQSWAYSSWSCSQHYKKKVTCWVCICIARAFGNLGWTNMHTHGRFNPHALSLLCLVMRLSHNQRCRDRT
jgi:hypothetical protein